MPTPEEARLIELLNERHSWPSLFAFKFIVPRENAEALRAALPEAERIDERPSSGGKYSAFTFHCAVASGREVLEIYARVRDLEIPGLLSL